MPVWKDSQAADVRIEAGNVIAGINGGPDRTFLPTDGSYADDHDLSRLDKSSGGLARLEVHLASGICGDDGSSLLRFGYFPVPDKLVL